MALPMSRKSAPGLQSLIASSRLWRDARMTRFESSSIRPTGYVSFRSPCMPGCGVTQRGRDHARRGLRTIVVQRHVWRIRTEHAPQRGATHDAPMLMMSPSCSFRWSGMPWQMTSFTDLRRRSLGSHARGESALPTSRQTWGTRGS